MEPLLAIGSINYDVLKYRYWRWIDCAIAQLNPLNAELNPICHLLALLGGATIVVVSRLRVKALKTKLMDSHIIL